MAMIGFTYRIEIAILFLTLPLTFLYIISYSLGKVNHVGLRELRESGIAHTQHTHQAMRGR